MSPNRAKMTPFGNDLGLWMVGMPDPIEAVTSKWDVHQFIP